MRVILFLYVFAIVVIQKHVYCKELPEFLQICHKNDPNINECIKTSIDSLRPYLIKGVPEYNIPTIEPLFLINVMLEETAGMNISGTDVKIYGLGKYNINNIAINFEENSGSILLKFYLDQFRAQGSYAAKGKLITLPVDAKGPIEVNVTNCNIKSEIKFEKVMKDGQEYLKFTSLSSDMKIGSGKVHVENLYGGDKNLSDMINNVVNNNFQMLASAIIAALEKNTSEFFLGLANKIVEPYTFDQLFPQ